MKSFRALLGVAAVAVLVQGCTGDAADRGLGPACSDALDAGYSELERARVNGFGGTVKWSRAASLLSAARIQEGFGEYQNCVVKAREARGIIREIR